MTEWTNGIFRNPNVFVCLYYYKLNTFDLPSLGGVQLKMVTQSVLSWKK